MVFDGIGLNDGPVHCLASQTYGPLKTLVGLLYRPIEKVVGVHLGRNSGIIVADELKRFDDINHQFA